MRDNDEEAISSEVTSTDSAKIQCLGDSDTENEDFGEVNESKKHIVDMDTMLDNYDPMPMSSGPLDLFLPLLS